MRCVSTISTVSRPAIDRKRTTKGLRYEPTDGFICTTKEGGNRMRSNGIPSWTSVNATILLALNGSPIGRIYRSECADKACNTASISSSSSTPGGISAFQPENCGILLIKGPRGQSFRNMVCTVPAKQKRLPTPTFYFHCKGGALNIWRVWPSKPKVEVNKGGAELIGVLIQSSKRDGQKVSYPSGLETSTFQHWQPGFHTRVSDSGGSIRYINLGHAREWFVLWPFCSFFWGSGWHTLGSLPGYFGETFGTSTQLLFDVVFVFLFYSPYIGKKVLGT